MGSMKLALICAGILILVRILAEICLRVFFKKDRITVAKAGKEPATVPNETVWLNPFESFVVDGKRLNKKEYILAEVDGDCMVPRGICSGDIVFIEDIKKRAELKPEDILLVQSVEDNVECKKLRELVSFSDGLAKTCYYTPEQKKKYSKSPYKESDILGVVKYSFEH